MAQNSVYIGGQPYMTKPTHYILLIERESGADTFIKSLERKKYTIVLATSGRKALVQARKQRPILIVLNAASLGSSGVRICHSLSTKLDDVPIIHILPESSGEKDHQRSNGDIILKMPFTSRKLVNRIKLLMPVDEAENIIEHGQIRLAPDLQMVSAYGREKRLTPKTAKLLEVFLTNPGKTLKRKAIMKQVWQTDYLGDTRTLDVHVRWAREAIEPNPGKPHHIQTVRGVGYRFVASPVKKKKRKKRRSKKKKKGTG